MEQKFLMASEELLRDSAFTLVSLGEPEAALLLVNIPGFRCDADLLQEIVRSFVVDGDGSDDFIRKPLLQTAALQICSDEDGRTVVRKLVFDLQKDEPVIVFTIDNGAVAPREIVGQRELQRAGSALDILGGVLRELESGPSRHLVSRGQAASVRPPVNE